MSTPQVKNRSAAAIQVTAEQILREAADKGLEEVTKIQSRTIRDQEELLAYQQDRRKDFESQLRRSRQNIGIWCRYALWEAEQKEFERARSIFERALDTDHRCQVLWLKYSEMEMKNKNINHARNIFDRVVTILPRIDTFWYKYTYMEELVGEIEKARQVFERWMQWEPNDLAWLSYIKFECRNKEFEKARGIFERYIKLWPTARAFLKYAKWEEEEQRNRKNARVIYERGLSELHPLERTEKFLVNFARFEERCGEIDRARMIYQYAIAQLKQNFMDEKEGNDDLIENDEIINLKKEFVKFEKRNGSQEDIEAVLLQEKRDEYEKTLAVDSFNYDLWLDYARLEESEVSLQGETLRDKLNDTDYDDEATLKLKKILENKIQLARSVYSRAVTKIPPVNQKRHWLRYIYLWINYALFEELIVGSIDDAREVYRRALEIIPHKEFTFGKIWLEAAKLEIRAKDLNRARKLLGQAIGLCGKRNIFRGYIEIELQLGEIDRCRAIYAKYVSTLPTSSEAWISFAQLEANVGETDRVRSIYELALSQPELNMPEPVWKSYIEWEVSQQESNRARELFNRLLAISYHLKVWISFAQFELSLSELGTEEEREEAMEKTREIFERGYNYFRSSGQKEERSQLLEAWKDAEAEGISRGLPKSGEEFLLNVENKLPRKIKIRNDEGEEVYDYVFPDDEKKMGKLNNFLLLFIIILTNLFLFIVGIKLLEKALKWKSKTTGSSDSSTQDSQTNESHSTLEEMPVKRSNPFPESKDENEIEFD